jgi:DNA-binding CsgD family transcriptional regulator
MTRDQPESLSPTERAIIESIRRGAPDAEIATRLGISILDVKRKVASLIEHFGVELRADLGSVDPSSTRPMSATNRESGDASTPQDDPGAAFRDYFTASSEPSVPVHSRRAVLGAFLAGGAAVTGVGAYFLLEGGNNNAPPARPDPFATNTPGPPPTPTATPQPAEPPILRPSLVAAADDAFEVLHFGRGEAIEVDHGMCFMDTASGEVTCYRLRPEPGRDQPGLEPIYNVGPGNRFVSAHLFQVGHFLFDRRHDEGYTFPDQQLDLVALGDRTLVLRERYPEFVDAPRALGRRLFVVTDELLEFLGHRMRLVPGYDHPVGVGSGGFMLLPAELLHGIDLEHVGLGGARILNAALSPFEQRLALVLFDNGVTSLVYVDLSKSDAESLLSLDATAHEGSISSLRWLDDDTLEVMTHRWPPHAGESQPIDYATVTSYRLVYRPAGQLETTNSVSGGFIPPNSLSSTSDTMVYETYLRGLLQDHHGEIWTSVVVAHPDGSPRFRVKSASLGYGDQYHGPAWLSDGNAFVALVQGEAPDRYAYGLVDAANGEIRPFPPLEPPSPGWSGTTMNFAPMPSPDNPALFSVGRAALFNLDSGDFIAPPIPRFGPDHLHPWGKDSAEMRFAFPHLGHGTGPGPILLPPAVERPPFEDRLRFVVARSETCLNLRAYPSLQAPIHTCLPDDSLLELQPLEGPPETMPGTDGLPPTQPLANFAVHRNVDDDIDYARVRTTDGRTGWVAIEFLDWAP